MKNKKTKFKVGDFIQRNVDHPALRSYGLIIEESGEQWATDNGFRGYRVHWIDMGAKWEPTQWLNKIAKLIARSE